MTAQSYYAIHVGSDWLPLGYLTPMQAKCVRAELTKYELIEFENMKQYLEVI
jgi:hypothetical protein